MDDYVHCFLGYIDQLPQIALTSPVLNLALSHTLAALMCPSAETQIVSLETLASLAKHVQDERWQPYLQPVFAQYGQAIFSVMLKGVVGDFPEESPSDVHTILTATGACAPAAQVELWAAEAVQSIPGHVVPAAERQAFLLALHE